MNTPLLKTAEVAEWLSVSSMTVHRLTAAGKLPAIRVGKNWRYRVEAIQAFLDNGGYTASNGQTPGTLQGGGR